MESLVISTLDVFTAKLYAGNPLGLVQVPKDHPLTEAQKQLIARELNYSETVFLQTPITSGSYTAQIFTPRAEIPFAGHPTIGTSIWIFENIEKSDQLTLNVKAGPVTLTYDRATKIATASIPHNVRIHSKLIPWQSVIKNQRDLDDGSSYADSPIVSIVRGMTFLMVDLTSQPELLSKVTVPIKTVATRADLDDQSWVASTLGTLFYKVLEEGKVTKIQQRMVTIGLEDPATGSASCALTCYLALQRGGAGQTYEFELDQGVEMRRPSKIFTAITLDDTGKAVERVQLRGQAVEVISGMLQVPADRE